MRKRRRGKRRRKRRRRRTRGRRRGRRKRRKKRWKRKRITRRGGGGGEEEEEEEEELGDHERERFRRKTKQSKLINNLLKYPPSDSLELDPSNISSQHNCGAYLALP